MADQKFDELGRIREELESIIARENLRHVNLFNSRLRASDEVGIVVEGGVWTVYETGERASFLSKFETLDQDEAIQTFLRRLRRTNLYFRLQHTNMNGDELSMGEQHNTHGESEMPAYQPPAVAYPPHLRPPIPAHMPPPPGYAVRTPTGQMSWALGFLAYIPIPILNLVVTVIVMLSVYPATERKGFHVASENARVAANWALTLTTVILLDAAYLLILGFGFPDLHQGFFPMGVGVIIYVVLNLTHLVVTICGTVIAGKNRVFRNRLAIPYLRAPRYTPEELADPEFFDDEEFESEYPSVRPRGY